MSNPMRFRDHTAFHLEVLRLTVAGAALYALRHLAGLVLTFNGRVAEALILAVSAATLGLVANPPTRKTVFTAGLLAMGVGLLGALCRMALPAYPWFGVGVYGLSIGVIAGRDLNDFRRYLMPLATGLTVVLGTYVEGAFRSGVNFTSYVPPFLAEPAYGAVFGFLVSVGLLLRQISLERDPVTDAFDRIKPTLSGEMLDLSQRAVTLYARIQQVLHDLKEKGNGAEPALTQVVKNLVMKIIHLGPKWNEVEREAGRTSAGDLTARIESLDKKIEETTDEVARKQYRMAREALGSQVRYLSDIGRSRERVVARVHNYLATLERLHLAVVNHRGADAAKLSDEIQPILDEIESIGHEMDFASEAISEVTEDVEAPRQDPPAAPVVQSVSADAPVAAEAAAPEAPAAPETAADKPKDPESSLYSKAFE
jgi:hypothetical protein